MQYLHSEAIIHRDLTSMNVLLQLSRGSSVWSRAVVANFGLSCHFPRRSEKLPQVGTTYFMSRECLKEEYYDEKAISDLRDSSGSSKTAIQRYIVQHCSLENNDNLISSNVRLALKRGVERGQLVQVSGSGIDGSFKLCEKKEYKVSYLRDKNNVNSEKRKPASPENRGPRSTKKSNVEKKATTPAPVKPKTKKAEAARTPNTVKSGKPTSARPKSLKKATAAKKK